MQRLVQYCIYTLQQFMPCPNTCFSLSHVSSHLTIFHMHNVLPSSLCTTSSHLHYEQYIIPSSLCTLSTHFPYAQYLPILSTHNIIPSSLCTLSTHLPYLQYLPILPYAQYLPIFPMHNIFPSSFSAIFLSGLYAFLSAII